jgi:hypothetical protein
MAKFNNCITEIKKKKKKNAQSLVLQNVNKHYESRRLMTLKTQQL